MCCFSLCLHFYCAMALGGSSANNKKLLSVAACFGLSIVRNTLGLGLALTAARVYTGFALRITTFRHLELEDAAAAHLVFGILFSALLLLCAAYYLITRVFLNKKLNLT